MVVPIVGSCKLVNPKTDKVTSSPKDHIMLLIKVDKNTGTRWGKYILKIMLKVLIPENEQYKSAFFLSGLKFEI